MYVVIPNVISQRAATYGDVPRPKHCDTKSTSILALLQYPVTQSVVVVDPIVTFEIHLSIRVGSFSYI